MHDQCRAPEGSGRCPELVGPHGADGLCSKHYQRLTKSPWGLEQPTRTAPLAQRFAAKVSEEPCPCGCDCVLWTGGLNPRTGYGNFSIDNKSYLAHRVAYEIAEGCLLPPDVEIDHVYEKGCRHRHCVKREHLEPVTHATNNRRIPMTPALRERRSAAGKLGAAARWGTRTE